MRTSILTAAGPRLRRAAVCTAVASLALTGVFAAGTSPVGADDSAMASCANLGNAGTLPANDDGSSDAVALPFAADFFGTQYQSLYVNNNGNVTFQSPQSTFTPYTLGADTPPIIAPFFADVDTTGPGSGLVNWGSTTFGSRPAFEVCWEGVDGAGVGYFRSHTDKLNNFQLLLVDRSDVGVGDFDIIFNYRHIQWETGDASQGSGGLGGISAGAGYSAGDGDASHFFQVPGSLENGAFLDSNPSGLAASSRNSTLAGRQIFPIRNGLGSGTAEVTGTVTGTDTNTVVNNAPVQICRTNDGRCVYYGSTTADGTYDASALPPGTYDLKVLPPANRSGLASATVQGITLNNGEVVNQNVTMNPLPGAPPAGSGISDTDGNNRGTAPGGQPVVYWNDPLALDTDACTGATGPNGGGQMQYQIILADGTVVASGPMTAGTPGTSSTHYHADVPAVFPNHGDAVVHFLFQCPNSIEVHDVNFGVYIDPSGVVTDQNGDPVAGATVTLLRADTASGPFTTVPDGDAVMSPGNRTNPDTTNTDGTFGWDVTAGFYQVEASKDGCDSATTDVLQIPPPVTDLSLQLTCDETPPTNSPPVVDAGPDMMGAVNTPITLMGEASDPDNDPLTINWTSNSDSCTFEDPHSAATTVTCTAQGIFTLTLSADDGVNAPVTDDASVTVNGGTTGPTCLGRPATPVTTSTSNGVTTITGTSGDDVIMGTNGNDVIRAGGGNDIVCARMGNDKVYGGTGNDILLGQQGKDMVRGQAGNDRVYGNDGNDTLMGNEGTDKVYGGRDNDKVIGGRDADLCNGGPGTDSSRTCETEVGFP